MAVILGLLALLSGPLLGPRLLRRPFFAAVLDAFVLVTVVGIVLLHVLPQSTVHGGLWALPLFAAGAILPAVLHRFDAAGVGRGPRDALLFVGFIFAAFVHAVLDGLALVHESHDEGVSTLAWAVLLHRVPVSLALWLVARPRIGLTRTVVVLVALGLGTVVGSWGGEALAHGGSAVLFSLVQAFAAGAILHIIGDAPAVEEAPRRPAASLLGVAAGAAVVVALHHDHQDGAAGHSIAEAFFSIAERSAPMLLVSLIVVAAITQRSPSVFIDARGPRVLQALRGAWAALRLQVCSCSVVSVFEDFLMRRGSAAGAVAFVVVAPALQAPTFLVTVALLGPKLALLRTAASVLLALLVAGVTAPFARSRTAGDADLVAPVARGGRARAVLDHSVPWLLTGIFLAAFLDPILAPDALRLPVLWQAPIFALVGVPLYGCATAGAPLALLLLEKGASPGAVMAFLLVGPVFHLTSIGRLARSCSVPSAVAFALSCVVGAAAVGAGIDAVLDTLLPSGWAWDSPDGSPDSAADSAPDSAPDSVATGAFERTAALAVFALALWSLLRQGARGFLSQVLHPVDDARGGHVHGPHCGHPLMGTPGFAQKEAIARIQVPFQP